MSEDGLEGVVVAETVLSDVDGARGRLVIRGHDVEELAGRIGYEAAVALLWGRRGDDADALAAQLGGARERAFAAYDRWKPALAARNGMDALRGALALMETAEDPAERDPTIVGATAVVASAWARVTRGEEPVAPSGGRSHAADYLHMVTGREPSDVAVRALDRYLVTVVDHGMNASTFAARVVASTGSDTTSAVVAAIGALKGPLHGGAPGPVLDMLDAIGEARNARAWLGAELAAGRRIMGMGHRVYRVRDPRAAVLEEGVHELARAGLGADRLALALGVEREAEALLAERDAARARTRSGRVERRLHANVELYTAVLLEAVGLPRALLSPTFAVSRVAGWCAHVAEQRAKGRLIRPSSRYVGPAVDEGSTESRSDGVASA